MDPEVYRNVLFSLSGLSCGAAFYALVIHAMRLREDFKTHIGFLIVKVAWIAVVWTLIKSIFIPITEIPPTFEGYLYGLAMVLASVGFILVARVSRRKWL